MRKSLWVSFLPLCACGGLLTGSIGTITSSGNKDPVDASFLAKSPREQTRTLARNVKALAEEIDKLPDRSQNEEIHANEIIRHYLDEKARFDHLLDKDQKNAAAWVLRGFMQMRLGCAVNGEGDGGNSQERSAPLFRDAKAAFETASTLQPDSPLPTLYSGQLLACQASWAEATTTLQAALDKKVPHPEYALAWLTLAHAQQGNSDQEEELEQRLLAEFAGTDAAKWADYRDPDLPPSWPPEAKELDALATAAPAAAPVAADAPAPVDSTPTVSKLASDAELAVFTLNKLAAPAFTGAGVDKNVIAVLSEACVSEASKRGGLQVIGHSDIEAMIGFEKQKEMLACDEASCMAELGGALGVDAILVGTIGKLGKTYLITTKLIDINKSRVLVRASVKSAAEPDALIGIVEELTRVTLECIPKAN